jgi:transposase IS116/IS110/IS902 family protein
MRALEDADARLEDLGQQVLALTQTAPYRTPVQYLQCFKGIDTLSAVTLAVETQDFRHFPDAPGYMKFTGLVCSEESSGGAATDIGTGTYTVATQLAAELLGLDIGQAHREEACCRRRGGGLGPSTLRPARRARLGDPQRGGVNPRSAASTFRVRYRTISGEKTSSKTSRRSASSRRTR